MTKNEVYKLKTGTWLKIWWGEDSKHIDSYEIVMLIEKPEREKGELSLRCVSLEQEGIAHVNHTQIIEVVGVTEISGNVLRYRGAIRQG